MKNSVHWSLPSSITTSMAINTVMIGAKLLGEQKKKYVRDVYDSVAKRDFKKNITRNLCKKQNSDNSDGMNTIPTSWKDSTNS